MSEPPFQIRPAVPADAGDLARLRFEFRTAIKEPAVSEDDFVERCGRWMAERLAPSSLWRCWVAEQGGQIVGNAWLQLFEKVPNPVGEREWYGYVTNLYVRPGLRSAGLGSALLERTIEECRARNVDTVILWPTPASRSLYVRHGFGPADDVLALYL